MNWHDVKLSLEMMSGGRNTVLFDNVLDQSGLPSVMVKVPKMKLSDLFGAAFVTALGIADDYHPAFKLASGDIIPYICYSKYLNVIDPVSGKAYSHPNKTPAVVVNHDDAMTACTVKGTGWHLMTNAEWALIQLLSVYQCMPMTSFIGSNPFEGPQACGIIPRGNNDYGRQKIYTGSGSYGYSYLGEKAIEATNDGGAPPITYITKTGTGPVSWNHDNTPWGISDLVGNVAEWVGGLRHYNREIQVLRWNESAIRGVAGHALASAHWYSIDADDGAYVATGHADAIKLGTSPPALKKTQVGGDQVSGNGLMSALTSATTASTIITAMQTIGLMGQRASNSASGGLFRFEAKHLHYTGVAIYPYLGRLWQDASTANEKMAIRGGDYTMGLDADIFTLDLRRARTYTDSKVGFRSCWIPT